jgi:hypothetical protein
MGFIALSGRREAPTKSSTAIAGEVAARSAGVGAQASPCGKESKARSALKRTSGSPSPRFYVVPRCAIVAPTRHATHGVPPPLSRWRMKTRSRSRRRIWARALVTLRQEQISSTKKGGGAPRGASNLLAASADAAAHPAGCARLSALHRDIRCGFDPATQPQAAFPKTWRARALPASACPSSASSSQTGRYAGRAEPRSLPGAGSRLPPAGIALAPLQGSSREAPLPEQGEEDVIISVTNVNIKETRVFVIATSASGKQQLFPGRSAAWSAAE